MPELKPCPFCGEALFPGKNVRSKPVMRHIYSSVCPLSEAQFLDTPGFRERWNRRSTADVTPVEHGQWEWKNEDWVCSNCGEPSTKQFDGEVYSAFRPDNCPNCGAKMDGQAKDG